MTRQTECDQCGKTLLFFRTDEHLRKAPFELVERGAGDFGPVTEARASRDVSPENRDLVLHDCKACLCITAGDLGADTYISSDTIAHRHPDCPLHGDEKNGKGREER